MKTAKKIRGILIWLLITILSLVVIYDSIGSPALTPEMAMSRREKAAWIGPSKVIWEGESCHHWYERMLLGETDYGYCLYQYDSDTYMRRTACAMWKRERKCASWEGQAGFRGILMYYRSLLSPRIHGQSVPS